MIVRALQEAAQRGAQGPASQTMFMVLMLGLTPRHIVQKPHTSLAWGL
jgi:hypothetical protein